MPDPSVAATSPAGAEAGTLVLRFDRTATERAVLEEWLAAASPRSANIDCVDGRRLGVGEPWGRAPRRHYGGAGSRGMGGPAHRWSRPVA